MVPFALASGRYLERPLLSQRAFHFNVSSSHGGFLLGPGWAWGYRNSREQGREYFCAGPFKDGLICWLGPVDKFGTPAYLTEHGGCDFTYCYLQLRLTKRSFINKSSDGLSNLIWHLIAFAQQP